MPQGWGLHRSVHENLEREYYVHYGELATCQLSGSLPRQDGRWYDYSSFGNHGTIVGATWSMLNSGVWVQTFDGIDDSVDCGAATNLRFTLTDKFTVITWVTCSLNSTDNVICSNHAASPNKGWQLRMTDTNKLRFVVLKTAAIYKLSDSAVITGANIWKMMAGSWDGTQCHTFVNGAEDTTIGSGGVLDDITATQNFVIGQYSGKTGVDAWDSKIGPIWVFKQALSAGDINTIYYNTRHLFGV